MTESMWCNGECSKRQQKKTPHSVYYKGKRVIYVCQICGSRQEYRR